MHTQDTPVFTVVVARIVENMAVRKKMRNEMLLLLW